MAHPKLSFWRSVRTEACRALGVRATLSTDTHLAQAVGAAAVATAAVAGALEALDTAADRAHAVGAGGAAEARVAEAALGERRADPMAGALLGAPAVARRARPPLGAAADAGGAVAHAGVEARPFHTLRRHEVLPKDVGGACTGATKQSVSTKRASCGRRFGKFDALVWTRSAHDCPSMRCPKRSSRLREWTAAEAL